MKRMSCLCARELQCCCLILLQLRRLSAIIVAIIIVFILATCSKVAVFHLNAKDEMNSAITSDMLEW
jgi:hypothetical protein